MPNNQGPGTIKRSKGIGGSDVGPLCGLNPRKSAYHLFLEKRGILPEELQVEDNERMLWGRLLEKPIAQEFARRTGRKIERQRRTIRHPGVRYMLANIDFWQIDGAREKPRGVLECKNHDVRQRKQWISGGIPDSHYLQLQHYLMVTGAEYGSFAVLFGGNEHLCFDIERDDNVIRRIAELEHDFWRRVELNQPPDFSYDQAGAELVRALYKEAETGKVITLDSPEAKAKVAKLLTIKEAIKKREAVEKELETWLKFQLQDAARARVPGIATVDWGNSSRKNLDREALEAAHPGLLDAFTKSEPNRRFTVKPEMDYEVEEDTTADEPVVMINTGVRQIQLD